MENPITVKHNGTEIVYDEKRNLFCFTLRGRDRTAESLAKAREIIDRPVKEKNTFQRFKAWWSEGYGNVREVEVTSIAESARWASGPHVWTSFTRGKDEYSPGKTERLKVAARNIYPRNEKNDALVSQIIENRKQQAALEEEREELTGKLKAYTVPQEEE